MSLYGCYFGIAQLVGNVYGNVYMYGVPILTRLSITETEKSNNFLLTQGVSSREIIKNLSKPFSCLN